MEFKSRLIGAIFLITGACTVSGVREISQTARIGQRIQLACLVPHGTEGSSVSWYIGEKQISYGTVVYHYASRMAIGKLTPNEFTLVIKSVVRSDDNTFTCKSTQQTYSIINLEVQWKPEFEEAMSSPYHVTMAEGSEGKLRCTAEGKPAPLIQWYRRPQNGGFYQDIGATGHTLTLRKVTRYVNDLFMCKASNAQGIITREMNLTVTFPPEVKILEEHDIYAQVGEQVLVTCLIQGSPLVKYYWKFKGEEIKEDWRYKLHVEHETGYPVYLLTLMTRPGSLSSTDLGTYTCHADGDQQEDDDDIEIVFGPRRHKIGRDD